MEPGFTSPKPKRTISVTNVILIMIIILLLALGMLSYLGYQNTGSTPLENILPNVSESPRFLFNIYGDNQHYLNKPMAVFVSDDGLIYVANTEGHNVEVFNSNGSYAFSFGGYGTEPGKMAYPYGITQEKDGTILVAESGNRRIQKFSRTGKYLGNFISSGNKIGIKKPGPLFADSEGLIYVGDLISQQVIIVDGKGEKINNISGINYPHGLFVDKIGNIYVSDGASNRLVIYNRIGKQIKSIDTWGTDRPFSMIRGVAVDYKGRIFISDTVAGSIRMFGPDSSYLLSFGNQGRENGNFVYPHGIFIDRKGKIYIADWGNNRVQVWGY